MSDRVCGVGRFVELEIQTHIVPYVWNSLKKLIVPVILGFCSQEFSDEWMSEVVPENHLKQS